MKRLPLPLLLIGALCALAIWGIVAYVFQDAGGADEASPGPLEQLEAPSPPATPREPQRPRFSQPAAPDPAPPAPKPAAAIEDGPPDTALSGTVVSSAGDPLAGAIVQLYKVSGGSLLAAGKRTRVKEPSVTDKRGDFRFDGLKGGTYLVAVEHGGYAPIEREGVEAPPGKDTRIADLRLAPGLELIGTVVDADSKPIEGATVALYTILARRFDGDEEVPTKQALTDERGNYRFAGLAAGVCQVTVAKKGMRVARSSQRELVPAREALRIDFELQAGLEVHGRVLNAYGEPVAGARIEARPFGSAGAPLRATTRDGGAFVLEGLGDEPLRVEARKAGYSPAAKSPVKPGDGQPVELRLLENAGITGFVVDAATKKPVQSFGLILFRLGKNDFTNEPLGSMREFQMTEDGSFTIEDVPPGRYKIQGFSNQHGPTWTKAFEVKRTHVFGVMVEMKVGAVLTGIVVDAKGDPIAGAVVRMFDNTYTQLAGVSKFLFGEFAELSPPVRSDEQGRFRFENLGAGKVQLRVSAPKRIALTVRDVAIGESGDSDAGTLVLGEGGNLAGFVIDPRGAPARGAKVRLSDATGESREDVADSAGEYSFEHLVAGEYIVSATPVAGSGNPLSDALAIYKTQKTATVIDGATVRLDLSVP